MKARVWKDRGTGRWCYDAGAGAMDCPTWDEALSEVLAAVSSHSAGLGLPLRIVPSRYPSPVVWTRVAG